MILKEKYIMKGENNKKKRYCWFIAQFLGFSQHDIGETILITDP